jgi:hypothetical protein
MFYGLLNEEFRWTCGRSPAVLGSGADFLSHGFQATGPSGPVDPHQQFSADDGILNCHLNWSLKKFLERFLNVQIK